MFLWLCKISALSLSSKWEKKKNLPPPPPRRHFQDQNSYIFTYILVIFLILVVYIVSLPCANFYVHSCCISGVQLICSCVFGYFQVHQVSPLKKIITSVFHKLFSSNNFFLALKSIYFHPRTSLNPPPLGFCIGGVAKLIIEKATPASLGITGVATMYVRVNSILKLFTIEGEFQSVNSFLRYLVQNYSI